MIPSKSGIYWIMQGEGDIITPSWEAAEYIPDRTRKDRGWWFIFGTEVSISPDEVAVIGPEIVPPKEERQYLADLKKGDSVPIEDHTYEIEMLKGTIKGMHRTIEMLCWDWATAHSHAMVACKQFYPAEKVDGDSYGVPAIEDLVDLLVDLIPNERRV